MTDLVDADRLYFETSDLFSLSCRITDELAPEKGTWRQVLGDWVGSREYNPSRPMQDRLSYEGRTFGYWTVLMVIPGHQSAGRKEFRQAVVRCACGKVKRVRLFCLLSQRSKSCGCKRKVSLGVSR